MTEPREGDQIVVLETGDNVDVSGRTQVTLLRTSKGRAILKLRDLGLEVNRNAKPIDTAPPAPVG